MENYMIYLGKLAGIYRVYLQSAVGVWEGYEYYYYYLFDVEQVFMMLYNLLLNY